MRAGLGMLDAADRVAADAPVGFVGVSRDEASCGRAVYLS